MQSNKLKATVIQCANVFIKNKSTVRETAKICGISKTTCHIYLVKKLPKINLALYKEARKILDKNKAERHIRGGMSTKKKYELLKNS